jgi:carbon storage regulator
MLVLSRQRDETIMIGDEVELTVVDIRGDKVRIGIKAPSHVAVHRKEVYDAIRNENQQAAAFRGELHAVRPRGRGPTVSSPLPASSLASRASPVNDPLRAGALGARRDIA